MRGLQASDVAHRRHGAREDAQALEDVVPRDLRDHNAAHRTSRPRTCSASWGSAATKPLGRGCTNCARRWRAPTAILSALSVQADETLVGGKGGPNKQLVLVAAEANGRVRLAHADNNDETCIESLRRARNRDRSPRRHRRARELQRKEPRRTIPRGSRCKPKPSGARTMPCRRHATG